MSNKNPSKKTNPESAVTQFSEEELSSEGTRSKFDYAEASRRRWEKVKDLKLRENRQRKYKNRAA